MANIWSKFSRQSKTIFIIIFFQYYLNIYFPRIKQIIEKKKKIELESPYLQKLSHSNFIQTLVGRPSSSNINSHRSFRHPSSAANLSRTNSALGTRTNSANIVSYEKYEPYYKNDSNKIITYGLKNGNMTESKTNLAHLHLSLRRERPSSAPIRRYFF